MQASLVNTGIADNPVCDQPVPYEQNDQRTNDRADKSRTLVGTIPADQLAKPRGNERARHSEHRGEHKAGRIVRAGGDNPRDNAGDKADENDPEDGRNHGIFSSWPQNLSRAVGRSSPTCMEPNPTE